MFKQATVDIQLRARRYVFPGRRGPDVKNSFPVQMAKYAVSNNIDHLPAFIWWVKHTLKKEKCLIKSIKSKYSQQSHKFGIYVPKTVQEALEIDRQSNTTYWRDTIQKEMTSNKLSQCHSKRRSLYHCWTRVLKSSGAAWISHLTNTLQQLGYSSCFADPDVWIRAATKKEGFLY